MADPLVTQAQIEAFAEAAEAFKAACDAIGVRPSSITFKTGRECNLIGDALRDRSIAGVPWFEKNVRILPGDAVEVCGMQLRVTWR